MTRSDSYGGWYMGSCDIHASLYEEFVALLKRAYPASLQRGIGTYIQLRHMRIQLDSVQWRNRVEIEFHPVCT